MLTTIVPQHEIILTSTVLNLQYESPIYMNISANVESKLDHYKYNYDTALSPDYNYTLSTFHNVNKSIMHTNHVT